MTRMVDPAGQHTQLGYDAAGNLVAVTPPGGSASQWNCDGLGRARSWSDAQQNVRRLERDVLGRVVEVNEPDGNQRMLAYDAEGNLVRAQDRQYDVRFEYSGVNRLSARVQNETRVEYSYDTEGLHSRGFEQAVECVLE